VSCLAALGAAHGKEGGLTGVAAVHGELTADGTRIVLIASGHDGEIAGAAKMLQTLTPLLKKTDPPGGLSLPATWPAVVQLAHTFGAAWRPGPALTAWTTARLAERTRVKRSLEPLGYAPPEGLRPYPWQVEGARMIAATGHALITDEPGTGKTMTTILGLVERAAEAPVLPIVVVCPASVVDPWVEAWSAWAPHWRAVAWRGAPAQRRALAGTADVYVTSYDTARMDAQPYTEDKAGRTALLKLRPAALVVDECHLIKNPHAVRSQAVRRLAKVAGNVVALSGTPITHHPADLWPTLVALAPDAWPSRERWVNRYCQVAPGDYNDEILGLDKANEPEFRLTLLGQDRRVAKADALDLPPKVYSVRSVELPAAYRKAYDDMEARMIAELPGGGELSVMGVLAQLTRLSQLASAAADVDVRVEVGEDGVERERVTVALKAPSWKVDALLEVLAERPGEPVVAFTPSRQLAVLAGQAAEATGLKVGYVMGGQAMRERTGQVELFQSGVLDLICVTTGAGGVGLTLTAARTAVFLQRPWSLVEALQAEDRCHRIGSERHDSIEIIDVIARDTIDSRVRSVLREKAGQLADLVQDRRIVTELLGGASASKLTRRSA
jgi:SNF2 family DNA or RNA helicase